MNADVISEIESEVANGLHRMEGERLQEPGHLGCRLCSGSGRELHRVRPGVTQRFGTGRAAGAAQPARPALGAQLRVVNLNRRYSWQRRIATWCG